MSLITGVRGWGLVCDGAGCGRRYRPKAETVGSAPLRDKATRAGWLTGSHSANPGGDWCPTCARPHMAAFRERQRVAVQRFKELQGAGR